MNHLVTRVRYSSTIEKQLKEEMDDLAQLSGIQKSKLLDEAIADLIQKYRNKGYQPKGGK